MLTDYLKSVFINSAVAFGRPKFTSTFEVVLRGLPLSYCGTNIGRGCEQGCQISLSVNVTSAPSYNSNCWVSSGLQLMFFVLFFVFFFAGCRLSKFCCNLPMQHFSRICTVSVQIWC